MNAARRKEIDALIQALQNAEADAESLAGEEREYYDNMPESFQQGEKGDLAEAAASALEEAVSSIQEAISQLEEAVQ